jgi:hypothetical protein
MAPTGALAVAAGAVRPGAFLAPLGVWALLAAVAVANGAFRETVLVSRLGEYAAHVLSTALLVGAVLVVSFLYFRAAPPFSRTELALVGALWTVLTVGFEFLVGYVEGTPVSETLAQYDVLDGQVWVAVPLSLLSAPLLFGWILGV